MMTLTPDPMSWLPTDETPLLDAAIAYASHGFRVITVWGMREDGRCMCGKASCRRPVGDEEKTSAGKHPIARGWQKAATSDVDAVADARRNHPFANIGIAMGGEARLVAVDIDGEQGRRSWAELEEGVEPAPATLTSTTGRTDGGEHRIYTVPAHLDIKRLGNRSSFRKMGIDTRIDGGQIVAAPSVHFSGARYRWSVRVPVAEMPDWLFEALAAPIELGLPRRSAPSPAPSTGQVVDFVRPYVRRVIENAAGAIAAARPGQRNGLLFAKACTVFEYHVGEGLDHMEAWRQLHDAARACGLPDGEVSSTLSKAWRKASESPGRKVPPPETPPESSGSPAATAPPPPPPPPPASGAIATANWEAVLVRTADGAVKSTFGNVSKILRNAPEFVERLTYNRMRVTPYVDGRPMRDSDVSRFREELESRWGFAPTKEAVIGAVGMIAEERSFHPVQDYLGGLSWDGEPRISKIAREVLGIAEPDLLTQRMLRCWFLSAVARALSPGCKVDTTLVLVGEQRRKKSTFFATLGGEWFSDSYSDIRTKDGVLQVHAAWIYEWAEIDRVTTRTSSSDVKAFLTIARDDVRPPYGMGVVNQPRSGVIVGTTNKPFLDDETGSRRFHPVRVEQLVDVTKLRAWRDQLWAEAVVAYRGDEPWWLSEDEESARESAASEHVVDNPWLERVSSFLAVPGRIDAGVTISDVIVGGLGIDVGRIPHGDTGRVGKTLRQLGWEPKQETRGGLRVRVYRPAAHHRAKSILRVCSESEVNSSRSQPEQHNQVDSVTNIKTDHSVSIYNQEPPLPGRAGVQSGEELFGDWLDRQ